MKRRKNTAQSVTSWGKPVGAGQERKDKTCALPAETRSIPNDSTLLLHLCLTLTSAQVQAIEKGEQMQNVLWTLLRQYVRTRAMEFSVWKQRPHSPSLPFAFTNAAATDCLAMFPTQKTIYNWYIVFVAATCMVLHGYDASVFNAVQGSKAWVAFVGRPHAAALASINTAYTVGAICAGFFVAGPLSTYTGRRIPMAIGSTLVIAATLMQVLGPRGTLNVFLGGRLMIGVASGICLPIAPVYIAEVAPARVRGCMLTFWQLFYSVGAFMCFWVSYAASRHRHALPQDWDWKLVVIFQLLAPLVILVNLSFIPESPRWLMQQRQYVEVRKVLYKIRNDYDEIDKECQDIASAIQWEEANLKGSYKPLWLDKTLRKRLLLAFCLNAGQQLTGQSSLNAYSTRIYTRVFTNPHTVQLINALNGTFAILFTLTALLSDRLGRRAFLVVGSAGMAILMLCAATVGTRTPTDSNGSKPHSAAIAIVFCLYGFGLFYKPSWGATVWIWTSEVFSMNVRGQAVGMSSQMQNVANAIVNQVFPMLLDKVGFYAFYMFSGINVLLGLFVFFLIPETRGRSLEEIDSIFGGLNHIEEGNKDEEITSADANDFKFEHGFVFVEHSDSKQ